jgi:diguanylate cyclase (GGDEF)-like protein
MLGHAAGDELLVVVTARLTSTLRESDTVARLGSDKFVMLVDQPSGETDAARVAERLLEVLGRPIGLARGSGRLVSVTASIGVAYGLETSAEQLLSDADIALGEARVAGKARIAVFDPRMRATA